MASIPCNYSVNVAKEYKVDYNNRKLYQHYCLIELGDCSPNIAKEKFEDILKRFTEEDGFVCDLQHTICYTNTFNKIEEVK